MNKTTTILQINVVSNNGSTGRIMEDLGILAREANYKSVIAYSRNNNNSKLESIKIGNKIDMYFHALITRVFDRHGLASNRSTKKLISQIKQIKPQLIHLHNIHGYFLNYKLLFKFLEEINIPIVWTLHDCWPFTGHCAYFDLVNCSKWKTGCYQCPQINEYPSSFFIDRSKKNYSTKKKYFNLPEKITLVPVSNWLSGLLNESILKEYPIQVIPNGINTELFTYTPSDFRKQHKLTDKTIILGVASVWDTRKGLNDFIKLSSLIDNNCVIVLIGLNKKQLKALPKNIHGIKRTSSIHELAKIYSTADVFLNPTWEDNYPTTNLESIACGTPVITYNTGGSIESITKKTGFIIKKGDLDAVVDLIKETDFNSYKTDCQNYAKSHFNKETTFKNYISLYKKLLIG